MIYVKTRSGRFMSLNHIVGFALEEQSMEMEGKKVMVSEIIAYLPEPLYPAILAIYYDHQTAEKNLENLMEKLLKIEKGIIDIETQI
jgi:hypothetical protein